MDQKFPTCHLEYVDRSWTSLNDCWEPSCWKKDCTGLWERAGPPGGQRPGPEGTGRLLGGGGVCVASKTPCRCRVSFLCAVPVPGGCAAVASSHHPRPPTLLVAECQGKCRALEVFPLCHFQVVLIFVRTIESYWVLMPSVAGFSLPVAFLVETCALCS